MKKLIDPSVVLYLPLYRIDGGSQVSRDAYGQAVNVTGALWTPVGRSFDGVDDVINCGAASSLDLQYYFTIAAWINPASYGENNNGFITAKGWNMEFRMQSAYRVTFSIRQGGSLKFATAPNDSISFNSWNFVVGKHDTDG